jgi:hypothetical protein
MLTDTQYTVSKDLLQEATTQFPCFDRRFDLTIPTGDFFYDKWIIDPNLQNSVWENILSTLPFTFGQARLMKLKPGEAYYSHADMDDRYHLNLVGEKSYLINLDSDQMFSTVPDGKWYLMNAGMQHSAVNFSNKDRIQLVVRSLLIHGSIKDPINVEILLKSPCSDFRYVFDSVFSTWLNCKNKLGLIDNFKIINEEHVMFTTERSVINELHEACPENFKIQT